MGMLAYSDVRIRLVKPDRACPHIAETTSRWQELRIRAAGSKYKDVARRLRMFDIAFEYPCVEKEGYSSNLEVRFRRFQDNSTARRGPLQNDKTYTIDELEECFEGWLEDAHQAEEKRR